MTKEDNDNITDVVSEEFIDSEEWKENLLKQGKWLRLLWMITKKILITQVKV